VQGVRFTRCPLLTTSNGIPFTLLIQRMRFTSTALRRFKPSAGSLVVRNTFLAQVRHSLGPAVDPGWLDRVYFGDGTGAGNSRLLALSRRLHGPSVFGNRAGKPGHKVDKKKACSLLSQRVGNRRDISCCVGGNLTPCPLSEAERGRQEDERFRISPLPARNERCGRGGRGEVRITPTLWRTRSQSTTVPPVILRLTPEEVDALLSICCMSRIYPM